MTVAIPSASSRRWSLFWPWLVLAVGVAGALWHTLDFPEDPDDEFPNISRPTFSRRPPPAYRLAEPGDTLDRIAIYLTAGSIVLSLAGLTLDDERRSVWGASLALSAAGFWHASTPGPTFDRWHGLGWRAIFDASTPPAARLLLAGGGSALAGVVAFSVFWNRRRWAELKAESRDRGTTLFLVLAAVLILLRQVEIPGVEPVGYWPRCALLWGWMAFNIALVRALPPIQGRLRWLRRGAIGMTSAGGWLALVIGGIWLTWYHRPLERLREIEPGKIYISAMPTRRGLEIAQARHPFKTIINLFPEDSRFRSPRLPDELRFAERNGIHYVGNTSDPREAEAFLDKTLALARDPNAWPILVHCHACQDRTPAWWGIYRFVVKGDSLADVMRDIERHRGWRPKASVMLLYNRVLAPRAPERYRNDPTAPLLRECAAGTASPEAGMIDLDGIGVNHQGPPRVSRLMEGDRTLPNLTSKGGSLKYPQSPRERTTVGSAPIP